MSLALVYIITLHFFWKLAFVCVTVPLLIMVLIRSNQIHKVSLKQRKDGESLTIILIASYANMTIHT